MREEGYYWVRQKPYHGKPAQLELARWQHGEWCLCGLPESFRDQDFVEISERVHPLP